MRIKLILSGLFCLAIIYFINAKLKTDKDNKIARQIIYIQPLGEVNPHIMSLINSEIKHFYNKKLVMLPSVPLTKDLLAKSKTRYDASKILKKFKSDKNILIITEKDIAVKYERRHSEEWGIFGLGACPGNTCVVSTFRLKRKATEKLFRERIVKVCIHELGHNLGLPHCKADDKCLMNDANGTISQVDKECMYFCDSCKKKIRN